MYGNKDNVIVLIDKFYNLLSTVSVRNSYKSSETSYSMVNMYHIITYFELVQLFQSKSNLSISCSLTLQVIFMETVENLMVGKETTLYCVIYKSLMKSPVYRSEIYLISPLLENIFQTQNLFITV